MLREIKFRGKRLHGKGWIVGNLFIPNTLVAGIHICPNTSFFDFYPGLEDDCSNMNEVKNHGIALGHFHEVIPETVGQFTGLKDNKRTKEFPNGQDIYEGDVVKRLTDDWEATNLQTLAGEDLKILTKEEVSHIVYRHNGFDVESESFGWEGEDLWDWDKIEIIGNIHELSKEVPNA